MTTTTHPQKRRAKWVSKCIYNSQPLNDWFNLQSLACWAYDRWWGHWIIRRRYQRGNAEGLRASTPTSLPHRHTHHAHCMIYRTPTLPLTLKQQQKKKKVTILVINMTMALQAKLKKPRTSRLNPGPEDIRIPRELTRTLKTRNQRPHNKGQLVQWWVAVLRNAHPNAYESECLSNIGTEPRG